MAGSLGSCLNAPAAASASVAAHRPAGKAAGGQHAGVQSRLVRLWSSVVHLLFLQGFVWVGHAWYLRQSLPFRLQSAAKAQRMLEDTSQL